MLLAPMDLPDSWCAVADVDGHPKHPVLAQLAGAQKIHSTLKVRLIVVFGGRNLSNLQIQVRSAMAKVDGHLPNIQILVRLAKKNGYFYSSKLNNVRLLSVRDQNGVINRKTK